jgi:hypothetical protein
MVQASRPIDYNVCSVLVESGCSANATARVELTEFKETVKHGTVFPDIEALELSDIVLHIVGSDDTEEVDVVI